MGDRKTKTRKPKKDAAARPGTATATTERLAEDPEISVPAELEDPEPIRPLGGHAFEIPDDLADRFRETGREWQGKAEAALALWLDEASLALRKDGLTGLRKIMEEKTERARERAESGELEKDVDKFVGKVAGTIGRDIAATAVSSALAAFAASAARSPNDASKSASKGTASTDPDPGPDAENGPSTNDEVTNDSERGA